MRFRSIPAVPALTAICFSAVCQSPGLYAAGKAEAEPTSCIVQVSETPPTASGSAEVDYKNTCQDAQQLTIQWSGTPSPVSVKLYRFPSKASRRLVMLGTSYSVKEGRATFGEGPTGHVAVERLHTTVPSTDKIVLHNNHSTYTLVQLRGRLHFNAQHGGKYSKFDILVVLTPPDLGDYIVTNLATDFFDDFITDSIQAEDDPT